MRCCVPAPHGMAFCCACRAGQKIGVRLNLGFVQLLTEESLLLCASNMCVLQLSLMSVIERHVKQCEGQVVKQINKVEPLLCHDSHGASNKLMTK